ncbi:zinc/cadmium/mercury/lead-transporting ATPase [Zobellella endophytica]|uniref:P-type Zn(2+) transporter n=1 Tax=Zobellella endophytica TaxID=2116700 RepID=A0A2P7QWL2_9GAMM|nr:heavy metal translocating P-type ATPase [Zobellella endophytica]PSJ42352.1 zinc/cadmium/mercury/lead-transporting ATPase [Zobellella endophytica]
MGHCCHHHHPKEDAAGHRHDAGCAPRTERANDCTAQAPAAGAAGPDGPPPDEEDDRRGNIHHWRIGGMDCPSCAAKIETAVRRLPGVLSAEVRFATERLQVRLAPEAAPATVEQAITAAGFTPLTEHKPASPAPVPWWRPQLDILILLVLMLAAALAGLLAPELGSPLFTLATFWGLAPIARQAWRLSRSGSPFSIETLMTVAATGALFLGETAEAAMVVLLFMVGEKLESLAASRARKGVKALMALVPEKARRLGAGGPEEVDASELAPGERIEVHPGGRLPADGELLTPLAAFDESAVTGESLPVERRRGERLAAGSLVVDVAVQLRVTSEPGNNTVDRILHLMEQAEANRAPIARFIERFSRWYTPAMMLAALLVILLPPLALGADWQTWIYRGLALLLIGCPCALVISTPAAVASALAAATRLGVLIKGGAALEQLGRIDTLAFDKTGTLTLGQPALTELVVYPPLDRGQALALAAGLESGSHHPLARALVAAAEAQGLAPEPVADKRTLAGAGIQGRWREQALLLCSPAHLPEAWFTPDQHRDLESFRAGGHTLVVLALEQTVLALFALADQLRDDAEAGINALRALNIDCLMLTGDHEQAAARIAGELGIGYRAGLKPEDKLAEVERLDRTRSLAMVGDGINDAPALRRARVGIAMGQGTDVALDSADVALGHNRLTGLADAIRLSRATHANIRQNVTLALGLKAIFLITSLTGLTGLWLAVLADTGATALVTLNALRLLTFRSRH